MAKLYYLVKRKSVYYVRFRNSINNKLSYAKSTGQKDKMAADRIAMTWLVKGFVPVRTRQEEKMALDVSEAISVLATSELTPAITNKIITILKNKKLIDAAIVSKTPSAQKFCEYLSNFWDYDKSEYIQEKLTSEHSIHKNYCRDMFAIVKNHYEPYFTNKTVGEITIDDMRKFKESLLKKHISFSRINMILKAGLIALKQAYYKKLTENNCFDGFIYCSNKTKTRKILSLEVVKEVFNFKWENETSKLANYLAFKTGMREGEIKALKKGDIKNGYLEVKNSWNSADKLKETKNNGTRLIPIDDELQRLLENKVAKNPYTKKDNAFVFWGVDKSKPADGRVWLDHLRKILKDIGYEDYSEITFHAWRHLFVSLLRGKLPDDKLQKITGHKTLQMLDHYSDHQSEELVKSLAPTVEKEFSRF